MDMYRLHKTQKTLNPFNISIFKSIVVIIEFIFIWTLHGQTCF